MEYIEMFLVSGVVMAVMDALWLSIIAKKFYRSQIGAILLDKPNMVAAILFYMIYIVGIVAFVIAPALEKGSWQYALTYGALFGFVAYATYDLTNRATVKGFTSTVAVVDMAWGAVLTSTVASASYWAIRTWLS